jgi:DNA-binding MarR family transcriptional regulator
MLNLMVAAFHVRDEMERACEGHDITEAQYNVLRILRGALPQGHARCEIASRMLSRAPDLTRLIDRLETRGLVERTRSESDRRQSVTRITRRGLRLLDDMQPTIDRIDQAFADRLSARDAKDLSRICEMLYGEEASVPR